MSARGKHIPISYVLSASAYAYFASIQLIKGALYLSLLAASCSLAIVSIWGMFALIARLREVEHAGQIDWEVTASMLDGFFSIVTTLLSGALGAVLGSKFTGLLGKVRKADETENEVTVESRLESEDILK